MDTAGNRHTRLNIPTRWGWNLRHDVAEPAEFDRDHREYALSKIKPCLVVVHVFVPFCFSLFRSFHFGCSLAIKKSLSRTSTHKFVTALHKFAVVVILLIGS